MCRRRTTAFDSIGKGPCTTDDKIVVAIVDERLVIFVLPTVHFVVQTLGVKQVELLLTAAPAAATFPSYFQDI